MATRYTKYAPYDSLDNMIHKIFRFMPKYEKQQIKKIINSVEPYYLKERALETISNIVMKYVVQNSVTRDEHRQDFIIEKIKSYIDAQFNHLIHDNCKFVDIGGGNGNVLSGLRTLIGKVTEKTDFVCVETLSDWVETYPFDNENITYMMLHGADPHIHLDIEPNSVDVILCMCSLHHMDDNTIMQMMQNMKRILKVDGKILIKEHDAMPHIKSDILWEHHLYHILDCAYNGNVIDCEEYYSGNIYNFKSKELWTEMLESVGFRLTNICNRFLDGSFIKDHKNVTELYWAVYEPSI